MMRGKPAPKRDILPDPRYHDLEVAKFINYIMRGGKKTIAQTIIYDCFDIIKEKTKQDPRHVFNRAIKQVSPIVEVRGKRVGGANYQVPYQVRTERRFTLACRWIMAAAKAKKGKKMAERLAEELIDAAKGEGGAMKKRVDVHRMAEANKAFAYFAR
ncbi:30S ribosomal protein S7 [Candidatus Falkowbacteria bacterium RIFOXYC2_FULL_47_12]|uniref:Small ribosomal subunit protein uS7 n=2 Tax=Candidatus Falkowiibacteriota TaxID=1752728 RepID=A0A1F5TLH4_9BACT|nr:MAG: 30S ribosomal protein S7 [Candidatus Falkowbacteria bacterium RIFOXYA2_FULL_47_9]OGF39770.1 MAG: 30S ribosomal protein S7 [Candidatus Falkowbacteria bacterium RIFOXYC2_FULL_47_12]